MVMGLAVMAVRGSVRRGRELHRHAHDLAVAHAALGDHMIGKWLHIVGLAPEHGHLQAGLMVEMHMQRSSDRS